MSVHYFLAPLDSQMLAWAERCSIPVAGMVADGRPATLGELAAIVKGLPECRCRLHFEETRFEIDVESIETKAFPCEGEFANTVAPGVAVAPAASTQITGVANADGVIEWMSFRGDFDLLLAVARELTATCGPQVYFADWEGVPRLVTAPGDTFQFLNQERDLT
jgi:hypothetical protein